MLQEGRVYHPSVVISCVKFVYEFCSLNTANMNTIDGLVSWLSTSNFLAWPLGLWAFYLLAKSLYNISPFHPLYHVPGPWLSAATYLPEFYYDVVKYGRYTWQIKKMHEKYGRTLCRNLTTLKESPSLTYASFPCPIVRINPDELHCNDTNFVSEIFAGSTRKRDKPRHQVNGLTYVLHLLASSKMTVLTL